jgi:hypothetical protein
MVIVLITYTFAQINKQLTQHHFHEKNHYAAVRFSSSPCFRM